MFAPLPSASFLALATCSREVLPVEEGTLGCDIAVAIGFSARDSGDRLTRLLLGATMIRRAIGPGLPPRR